MRDIPFSFELLYYFDQSIHFVNLFEKNEVKLPFNFLRKINALSFKMEDLKQRLFQRKNSLSNPYDQPLYNESILTPQILNPIIKNEDGSEQNRAFLPLPSKFEILLTVTRSLLQTIVLFKSRRYVLDFKNVSKIVINSSHHSCTQATLSNILAIIPDELISYEWKEKKSKIIPDTLYLTVKEIDNQRIGQEWCDYIHNYAYNFLFNIVKDAHFVYLQNKGIRPPAILTAWYPDFIQSQEYLNLALPFKRISPPPQFKQPTIDNLFPTLSKEEEVSDEFVASKIPSEVRNKYSKDGQNLSALVSIYKKAIVNEKLREKIQVSFQAPKMAYDLNRLASSLLLCIGNSNSCISLAAAIKKIKNSIDYQLSDTASIEKMLTQLCEVSGGYLTLFKASSGLFIRRNTKDLKLIQGKINNYYENHGTMEFEV